MISWERIVEDADQLAKLIQADGFHPSMIVALSRGGFVPARLLANGLEVKELLAIGVRYEDAARTKPLVYALPAPLAPSSRVLLVEDCTESGKCLAAARAALAPLVAEIRTASLYDLLATPDKADYCLKTLTSAPPMPWEARSSCDAAKIRPF